LSATHVDAVCWRSSDRGSTPLASTKPRLRVPAAHQAKPLFTDGTGWAPWRSFRRLSRCLFSPLSWLMPRIRPLLWSISIRFGPTGALADSGAMSGRIVPDRPGRTIHILSMRSWWCSRATSSSKSAGESCGHRSAKNSSSLPVSFTAWETSGKPPPGGSTDTSPTAPHRRQFPTEPQENRQNFAFQRKTMDLLSYLWVP